MAGADTKWMMGELKRLRAEVDALSRGSQLDRSTVEVAGESVAVPRALAAGIEAVGLAGQALESANGKNRVIYSDVAPDVAEGMVTGDVWWQRDAEKRIIGQWQFDGSAWVSTPIDGAILANIDAGSITFGTMRGIDFEAVNIRGSSIDGVEVSGEGFNVRGDDGSVLLKIAKEGMYVFPKGYWDEVPGEVAASPGGSMQVVGADTTGFALRLNRFQPVGSNLHWRYMEIGSRNHPNAGVSKPAGTWEHTDGGVDVSADRSSFASMLVNLLYVVGTFFANTIEVLGSIRSPQYQNPNGHPSAPFSMASGRAVSGPVNANGTQTVTVQFPAGRFTVAPRVTPNGNRVGCFVTWGAVTATSAEFLIRSTLGNSLPNVVIDWIAVQMTPTSADG